MEMTPLVIGAAAGMALTLGWIAYLRIQQAGAKKEFAADPFQRRLADHIDTFTYSSQDEAAYQAMKTAVGLEFTSAGVGIASPERLQRRLLHAAGLNHQHIKSGLKKKPSPQQTIGAAKALIRLSEDL